MRRWHVVTDQGPSKLATLDGQEPHGLVGTEIFYGDLRIAACKFLEALHVLLLCWIEEDGASAGIVENNRH